MKLPTYFLESIICAQNKFTNIKETGTKQTSNLPPKLFVSWVGKKTCLWHVCDADWDEANEGPSLPRLLLTLWVPGNVGTKPRW